MEVIHISSALNNNLKPSSCVEKAFLLACRLCFVPLLKLLQPLSEKGLQK